MRRHFTPTELRILALLADGRAHRREELLACLSDELAAMGAISVHVCNIRKLIRPRGEEIVCELNGTIHYRHVRLITYDE